MRHRGNEANARSFDVWIEMWSIGLSGGRMRCRNKWEKMLFVVAMISSLLVVSVISAKFCMHSTTDDRHEQIDTFDKIAVASQTLENARRQYRCTLHSRNSDNECTNGLPNVQVFASSICCHFISCIYIIMD